MFQALVLDKTDGQVSAEIKTIKEAGLPEGDVTVAVAYTTLNWKDGAIIKGAVVFPGGPGVTTSSTSAVPSLRAYSIIASW